MKFAPSLRRWRQICSRNLVAVALATGPVGATGSTLVNLGLHEGLGYSLVEPRDIDPDAITGLHDGFDPRSAERLRAVVALRGRILAEGAGLPFREHLASAQPSSARPEDVLVWLGGLARTTSLPLVEAGVRKEFVVVAFGLFLIHPATSRVRLAEELVVLVPLTPVSGGLSARWPEVVSALEDLAIPSSAAVARFRRAAEADGVGRRLARVALGEIVTAGDEPLRVHLEAARPALDRFIVSQMTDLLTGEGIDALPPLPPELWREMQLGTGGDSTEARLSPWVNFRLRAHAATDLPAGAFVVSDEGYITVSARLPRPDLEVRVQLGYAERVLRESAGVSIAQGVAELHLAVGTGPSARTLRRVRGASNEVYPSGTPAQGKALFQSVRVAFRPLDAPGLPTGVISSVP